MYKNKIVRVVLKEKTRFVLAVEMQHRYDV